MAIVKEIINNTAREIFICFVSIQPSTEQALEELKKSEDFEVDFVSSVTPFYYSVNQRIIYEHYKLLSENLSTPLLAYDIPSCTHNKIELDLMLKISSLPNVIGIKDTSGDMSKFSISVRILVEKDFSWIQGDDNLDSASLQIGSTGIVTGGRNMKIEPYIEMLTAYKKGDIININNT